MLLAGDVGGTKTLLGLFEADAGRPRLLEARSYPTAAYTSFSAMLDAFRADLAGPLAVDAVAVGVAGPVVGGQATLTNIGWAISAAEIARDCDAAEVRLLNDLEAMATSVEALQADEIESLQAGTPDPAGNAAVIAAGTGLGAAVLHRIGNRLLAVATESGHADFAPRTEREIDLLRLLRGRFGRAEVEQVLSGSGIVNLHRLTHAAITCRAVDDVDTFDAPARISQAAIEAACPACVEAISMFVEAYGAEAGNLALRSMATAGVYVGGGIAPKILPMIRHGRFMNAFLDKAPMHHLVARIPVFVILNPEAGLLGAAVAASRLPERVP